LTIHRAIAAPARVGARKDTDLAAYWPRSEAPYGFMTHHNNGGIPNHGFTHWWTMFNPRQLLVNALLLKAINEVGGDKHRWEAREYVLAAFQQYLRNQNMFCFWDIRYDKLEPHMSNNNYHPKHGRGELRLPAPRSWQLGNVLARRCWRRSSGAKSHGSW
jgi:putative DNA methylase